LLSQARIGHARVILHGPVQPFHLESLREAGIADADIVQVPPRTAVVGANVTWVTPTFFHHMPHPEGVALLRNLPGGRAPGSRRIYAARSGVAIRRLVNEEQLERLLQDSFGFEVVRPESLTFAEQRQMFPEISIFAAPFGAALANCAFMPRGSAVVVVETKRTLEFIRLAAQLSLKFVSVPTEAWPVRPAPDISHSHEYGVRLRALAMGIEVAMSLVQPRP
jgi:capsular polysaccharide biosynthesis protein